MHQRHIPWASSLSSSSYHHLHHVHHHPHHHLFGDVVHQRPSVLTIRRTIHLSLWLFSVHQFCFFLSLQLAQYLATQVALDPTPVIKSLSWTELRTSFKASLQACCSLLCCYVYSKFYRLFVTPTAPGGVKNVRCAFFFYFREST